MNNPKLIKWQKWYDPCATAWDEYQSFITEAQREQSKVPEELKFTNEDISEKPYPIKGPIISGPMGIVPINEGNLPSKLYELWIGHTNFDITYKVKTLIEMVSGVETLDIWTRYRFRVGIGMAFMDEKRSNALTVLRDIEYAVTDKKQIFKKTESIKDYLAKRLKNEASNK